MSKFDVFVNGIQPDYLSETKRITEELSEKLRINNQIAEKIIKSSNSRISQSISKSQAEKLQLALYKMGVICVCKPSVEATRLSLESVKKKRKMEMILSRPVQIVIRHFLVTFPQKNVTIVVYL